jgi:hypothetical protein
MPKLEMLLRISVLRLYAFIAYTGTTLLIKLSYLFNR